MKYSFNWLRELSGTKRTAEKVAEDLTMHSFEIEGLEKSGIGLENVVVGKILEIEKHPNADRLQVTKVDVGHAHELGVESESPLQIVCGAHNIKVGDKVPVALPGAKLPSGMEIKETNIRGVDSFGMLCAEDELGIGDDHSGIWILGGGARIGASIAEYTGGEDFVIEMKVLPDRAHDAYSHVGVAREIAVLEGREMEYDFDGMKMPKKKSKKLRVEIKDKTLCRRYIGAVIENVTVSSSPFWVQNRLKASGMNPINNIVDITNYVMLELGNPLHAFDADKLNGNKILVRRAENGEEINLLDKGIKKLTGEDLLITDGEGPAALAGIKGARIAEIDENTKNIVLEAASFDAVNVRKTRTRLGIKTESSDRFEKDIDSNLAEKAMVRAIELIEHLAGGKVEGIVDEYPKPIKPWKIKLDLGYVNKLLGEKVSEKETNKILTLLGIKISRSGKKGQLDCLIPTFRVDLKTQEDLIEEIGRIWGYEKIEARPIEEKVVPPAVNEQSFFERKAADILAGLGYDEVYNYSFYSQTDADRSGLGGALHLQLANPMNPEQQLIRVSLIPNVLKNIRENLKHFREFKIFELGRVYQSGDRESELPEEKRMLVMAVILEHDKKSDTFFLAKGDAEEALEEMGIGSFQFNQEEAVPQDSMSGMWHPTRRAGIVGRNGEQIGYLGEINPLILSLFKINKRVVMVELDMERLRAVSEKDVVYKSIQKFPKVVRDLSMLVDKKVRVADIVREIRSSGELVLGVELFDIFEKGDKNSFAFHIELGATERTLEGKEVDELMKKIIESLEKNLTVEMRK